MLRESRLVTVRTEAQKRVYGLRAEWFMELHVWLEPYRRCWRSSLDALERHLDAMPDAGKTKVRKRKESR